MEYLLLQKSTNAYKSEFEKLRFRDLEATGKLNIFYCRITNMFLPDLYGNQPVQTILRDYSVWASTQITDLT